MCAAAAVPQPADRASCDRQADIHFHSITSNSLHSHVAHAKHRWPEVCAAAAVPQPADCAPRDKQAVHISSNDLIMTASHSESCGSHSMQVA